MRTLSTSWIEPSVLILGSLAGGPKHGYSLQRDIESDDGVALGAGTLYGALARLEAKGWISALSDEGRRRPYELTTKGAAVLAERLERMRIFVSVSSTRLKGLPA